MITLNTCEECGNMGTPDSWPFVMQHESLTEEGVFYMLCEDCCNDYWQQVQVDQSEKERMAKRTGGNQRVGELHPVGY